MHSPPRPPCTWRSMKPGTMNGLSGVISGRSKSPAIPAIRRSLMRTRPRIQPAGVRMEPFGSAGTLMMRTRLSGDAPPKSRCSSCHNLADDPFRRRAAGRKQIAAVHRVALRPSKGMAEPLADARREHVGEAADGIKRIAIADVEHAHQVRQVLDAAAANLHGARHAFVSRRKH